MSMRHRPAIAEHRTHDGLDPTIVNVTPRGSDVDRAPVEPAVGGNGLTTQESPSIWGLLSDTTDEVPMMSEITVLLERLEESTGFRRSQSVGCLNELKEVLDRVSHTASADETVSVEVGLLVVMAHTLLRHQP